MTNAQPEANRTRLNAPQVERIGHATARLHRLLKELGHTRSLEKTASTMPDARDRLNFIDQSMHEASEKTISAVETALPMTTSNRERCATLATLLSDQALDPHRPLLDGVLSGLGEIAAADEIIHDNLMHIMEAQEFRDIAGQMVNKIVQAAVEIETIMLELLKEYAPNHDDSLIEQQTLTAGPAHKQDGSLQGQDEVDDLLSSLGL